MKNRFIIAFLFLTLVACRDKKEEMPPCADIAVDTSQLSSRWSQAIKDNIEPIVFEDKVLIVEPLSASGNGKSELYCFNDTTGELLWQKTLPAYLLGDEVQISGSKLYYTNGRSKTFRAFDLNTLEDNAVCTLNSEGYLARHFALGEGYAIFLDNHYLLSIDSMDVSAYLVDLQNGVFRRTITLRTKYSYNGEVIFDPTTEITPDGDTLFCFMEFNLLNPSHEFVHRFVCQNIVDTTISATAYHQSFYASNKGNLILENGKAYFALDDSVFCLEALTATPIWKKRITQYFNDGIALKGGRLLVFHSNRFLDALDPINGESRWQSRLNIGSVESLKSSFFNNGRLYFIDNSQLTSIDVETGCRLSNQSAPSGKNLLSDLAQSADGKRVYVSDHYNLYAVSIK
ncbi:MAG: PQQ-binding-like beta-propeller repeat protein [Phycisphaerae bacterium]|nr:PQQ-binding-like beta-propeller repeat protein [Saprospiraceae bacterium]